MAQLESRDPAVSTPDAAEWNDVLLPRGFFLDLATGGVADRAPGGEFLRYENGELLAEEGAVGSIQRSKGVIQRGEQVHGSRWIADRDLLLGYDLGVRGWGLLRVLEVTPNHVSLERWSRAGGQPGTANWKATRWNASSAAGPGLAIAALTDVTGGPWRVESRRIGGERRWNAIGEWDGAEDFIDAAAGSTAIREYRFVPLDPDGLYGMRARGVAGRRTEDATAVLKREDRVNLLTSTVSTERFDLTVVGVSSGGVNITPELGVRIATLNPGDLDQWELPADDTARYANQQRYLGLDRELGVILPEGVFVHLRAVRGDDSGARLVAELNPWGDRLFMPTPGSIAWNWSTATGVSFAEVPKVPDAVSARIAGRLLERETEFDSNQWIPVDLGRPGATQLDADPGPNGVVRYRCTWVTREGERGPAGTPFGVLVGDDGGASSAALVNQLIASLGHRDFDQRRRAKAGLQALSTRVLPELRAAMQSSDAEVVAAARELINAAVGSAATSPEDPFGKGRAADREAAKKFEAADRKDAGERDDDFLPSPLGGVDALLDSLASARGLSAAPPGWSAPQAGERASALLAALDRAPAGFEPWRALLAEADPDPGVRLVASLYPELARAQTWAPSYRAADATGSGELIDQALRGLDANDPWPTLVRMQLLHRLNLTRAGTAEAADARENAMLALQLLQRHAVGGEPVFLDAALQIVDDPRARLRAARNLFELRDAERVRMDGRTEVLLEAPDATLLIETLEALRNSPNERIDLILPEGDYQLEAGDLRTARVFGDGLRIIGQGRVRLAFGLIMQGAANVSFENLEIDPRGAACLRVQDANAVLIGCRLRSVGQGIQVNSGLLELIDCEVVDQAANAGKGGNGIRLMGRSACRLLRTRVEAGGDALIGARLALVERSVLDGGARNAISGMSDGELLAVDSLIRSGSSALHTIDRGLLEGCILLGDGAVASQLGPHVDACPAHVLTLGPEGPGNAWARLASCPAGR